MIATIAKKELKEMVRDGRFRWGAGVALILLVGALLSGTAGHRRAGEERAAARELDRRTWIAQGAKNPHSAAHYGIHAFKPDAPLALADGGITAYVGHTVWLEAHWQNMAQHRPAEDRTAVQRLGELTAAAVLQLLVPLLIVLLTFGAFAGEREHGTLRQLMSLGLPRRTLALGKAAGVAAGLGLLLVPAALVGAAALGVASAPAGLSPSLPRVGLMAVAYLLYFGALVGVSLAASARASSARIALVALLGFWIANGLVMPRAMADLSERLHPTPSSTALWGAMRDDMANGLDGHDPQDQRRKQLEQRVLEEHGVTKVEELPVSFAGIALQEGEEYGNKVFDKHFGALWATYERQNRVQLLGAIAAPLLAVRSASMGFAGTDWAHHRHFVAEAEGYRREVQRVLNGHMTKNAKGRDFDYRADASFWETVKPFAYESPGAGWALGQQAGALGLLAAWCALGLAAAVLAATRVRVIGGAS
jgi:ABC-2 type transport system permease protein